MKTRLKGLNVTRNLEGLSPSDTSSDICIRHLSWPPAGRRTGRSQSNSRLSGHGSETKEVNGADGDVDLSISPNSRRKQLIDKFTDAGPVDLTDATIALHNQFIDALNDAGSDVNHADLTFIVMVHMAAENETQYVKDERGLIAIDLSSAAMSRTKLWVEALSVGPVNYAAVEVNLKDYLPPLEGRGNPIKDRK